MGSAVIRRAFVLTLTASVLLLLLMVLLLLSLAGVLSVVAAVSLPRRRAVLLLLLLARGRVVGLLLVARRSVLLLVLRTGLLLTTTLGIVHVVVRLKQFLSKFLLALVNVLVEFVSVFTDGKLLIVIDRDVNAPFTVRLILGTMKLRNIRMLKCLFSRKPFVRVEV